MKTSENKNAFQLTADYPRAFPWLDLMTLILKPALNILKMSLSTKNEVYKSRQSKLTAGTRRASPPLDLRCLNSDQCCKLVWSYRGNKAAVVIVL